MDVFAATAEFNREVIGLPRPKAPARLSLARRDWASVALLEEVKELEDASTIEDEVDALVDVIYFAAGRLYEMGVDGAAHFAEVHRANMGKVRGELSKRPNSLGYDAIKPEGWTSPDHTRVLAEASRRPRVLVLGHARHGKDTVAEMLRDRWGLRFSSSSMFCAERVMMPYFAQHGVPYASVEECYEDRVNHRSTWFDKIQDYNRADPSRLAREMLEAGNDMYVGMRSAYEFAEAHRLFDFIVWVDASGRGVPPEPRDSFDIGFSGGMLLIRNDGTLQDLEAAVDRLAKNHLSLEA